MNERVIEFMRGMRAAGVRVSMAEGMDAFRAIAVLGIADKATFREALRTTLVKESKDFAVFERLFPLYFSGEHAPLEDASAELTSDELAMLQQAIQQFNQRSQQLLEWLTSGDAPSKEALEEMARNMAQRWPDSQRQAYYVNRAVLRELGLNNLQQTLQALLEALQERGMNQASLNNLLGSTRQNAQSLREQVAQAVGLEVSREQAARTGNGRGSDGSQMGSDEGDIMHRPFEALSFTDTETLRVEVKRLVQQLRSRAALRRKRGKKGKFDPKSTIRANMQYGGVPIALKFKRNKIKPRLLFMVDVSGSMERIIEFLLRFVHQLQDQVSKIDVYTFYGELNELHPKVVELVGNNKIEDAFYVIRSVHPYRPYATNLGRCLESFHAKHLRIVDHKTTVVFLGDGRNNYTASRADLVQDLQRRAKRLIWLNPEQQREWGTGDSDMLQYMPYCDDTFVVSNLSQLSYAIDSLLAA